MSPKQYAEDLIDKMYNTEHCGIEHFPNKRYCDCTEMSLYQAKQCALVAVDEVLNVLPQSEYLEDRGEYCENRERLYWKEVKQEIQKL
jgi:hypothetical protein